MRLVFFGSDPFALPTLRALHAAGHELVLVVTNPDRRRGRSKKLVPNEIKQAAEELGAPVVTPEGRPGKELAEQIRASGAELGVVVAYGQFLTKSVRGAPSLGYSINLHGSLLPRWRGAAPVAYALRAGDEVTGVSVQKVARRMDAGDVLGAREVPVQPDDTRGSLRERLAELGGPLVVEVVAAIAAGSATFTPQDEQAVTHASLLSKEDGRLDPAGAAVELERQVRAFQPWPGAYFELEEGRLAVVRAALAEGSGQAGEVLAVDKEREALRLAVGEGALDLLEVKPVGKRAMTGMAFANGRRLKPGANLLS